MSLNKTKTVLIVGGGIGGLATAFRLQKLHKEQNLPLQIRVLEASDKLGGLLSSHEQDGFLMEDGPDGFITDKPAALNLVKELGNESELIGTLEQNRRSFILKNRRLIPTPKGVYLMAPASIKDLWASPLLSWKGKFRVAMEPWVPKKTSNKEESLAEFVSRRLGQEALERIAQPMIGGIYGTSAEILSLKATMPRFLKMEEEEGSIVRALRKKETTASGPRYGMFMTFKTGIGRLVEILRQNLDPETLYQGERCEHIAKENATWVLRTNKNTHRGDHVIFSVPTYVTAQLLTSTQTKLSELLSRISYASSATLNLGYERKQISHSLGGMGFVVPEIEDSPIVGCSFSSMKYSGRAPKDHVLLRAFVSGSAALNPNVDDIQQELSKLLGISGAPKIYRLRIWKKSMPQYQLGHLDLVDKIEEQVEATPGLHLVGNAFRGVGIPDVIRCSEKTASKIMGQLVRNSF